MRRDAGGDDASSPLSQIWQPLKPSPPVPRSCGARRLKRQPHSQPLIIFYSMFLSVFVFLVRTDLVLMLN